MPETIRTAQSLMETAQLDTIQAGGPSSSKLLNQTRDALLADLAELDRRTAETEETLSLNEVVFQAQVAAITARLSALESQLPVGTSRWLADFYVADYYGLGSDAALHTEYGQVTLPILRSQENLVGYDSRDRIWVPQNTRISYATTSGLPLEQDWRLDERAAYALDGRRDTAWWRERPATEAVWVRVQVSPNLHANKLSNAIVLHPFPALAMHLGAVQYRTPAGSWADADLSYLLGWDADTARVQHFGPLRIWLPPTQVTEFRLQLDLTDATCTQWGFSHLGLQWLEFQPQATLVADFSAHNPGTLAEVTLHGRDQDALGYLATSISGDTVSVGLTQLSQGTTPVLTGVEVTT